MSASLRMPRGPAFAAMVASARDQRHPRTDRFFLASRAVRARNRAGLARAIALQELIPEASPRKLDAINAELDRIRSEVWS